MESTGDHPGYEHARLRDVKRSVRKANIPFAIVRNPWSRVVSRFTFSLLAMEEGRSPADYSAKDFEAFLEERHIWGSREYFWHRAIRGWYPQKDYVTDEDGSVPVNILRLEHFNTESQSYFNLDAPLQKRNISKPKQSNFKSYYTDKTIQIVADWYAQDIEYFGFDFDTSATKNTLYS